MNVDFLVEMHLVSFPFEFYADLGESIRKGQKRHFKFIKYLHQTQTTQLFHLSAFFLKHGNMCKYFLAATNKTFFS